MGAGQSACEIAGEIADVAERTWLSVRRGVHVLPRYLRGVPYDTYDRPPFNLLPWPVLRVLFSTLARASREDPKGYGLPEPSHRFLEQIPTINSDLPGALRRGKVAVRPAVERLDESRVCFVDGSAEEVDLIVCATGYQIRFPFLPPALVQAQGKALRLYRRIIAPGLANLFFVGLMDTPGGLLPVVEAQSAWIADVLQGRIRLPATTHLLAKADATERRTRRRFPEEPAHSIRCDPHAYQRLIRRDRRVARLTRRGR